MALQGKGIVLYVDVDPYAATPTGTPDFKKVGAQRGFSNEETSDNFETTSKDSTKSRTYEYLFNSGTISLDGLNVPTDEGLNALKKAQRNHDKVLVEVWEDDAAVEEATALISTRTIEAPYDDASTYSVELQISGEWTELP